MGEDNENQVTQDLYDNDVTQDRDERTQDQDDDKEVTEDQDDDKLCSLLTWRSSMSKLRKQDTETEDQADI